ncbi:diguanylate cyclase domain-containing protein [Roseateles sp.]|uniref:diguanylate cyclase domain-containing protein n=1 Tax=Roseateles sp. TaxID=1971397 RepID=UPI003BA732CD
MRLRTALVGFVSSALLLTLGLALSLAYLARQSHAMRQLESEAHLAVTQISELLVLTHEFGLHGEPRTVQQWQALHGKISQALAATANSRLPAPVEASAGVAQLGETFALLAKAEALKAATEAPAPQALQARRNALLLSQLLADSRAVTESVQRWSLAADQQRQHLDGLTTRLSIAIPVLMLLLFGALAVLLFKRVLDPLRRLNLAVEAISKGDLSVRSATATDDEFGELSRHFDAMAVDLVSDLRHEVKERQQAEAQLRLAASVFSHAREGIMITAADGAIIDVNATFSEITGFTREEVLGQNPRLLKSGRHDEAFYRALWTRLLEKDYWTGEIWNRRKSGEIYAEMQTISAIRDEAGRITQFVSLFSDITTLKDHELRLRTLAYHDALTGLPNRVLLQDRLQQAMAQAKRRGNHLALAFVDLDAFKAINDQYGHAAGDALLVGVAQHIKQVLREGDTFARLGGDEFIVLLADLPSEAACEPLLERVLEAASLPVTWKGLRLQVSASLGVACYPGERELDPTQLLQQADHAMYRAKQEGRNRFEMSGPGDLD